MAPYDPVAKYGSGWKEAHDGTIRRVVIYQGKIYKVRPMCKADEHKIATVLKTRIAGKLGPFETPLPLQKIGTGQGLSQEQQQVNYQVTKQGSRVESIVKVSITASILRGENPRQPRNMHSHGMSASPASDQSSELSAIQTR